MIKLVLTLTMLTVVGCSSFSLKPDYTFSSSDSNYHSAEIVTESAHNFGVVAARADVFQPYTFSVAGIYKGIISVKSKECGYDESVSYSNTGLVTFEVPVRERCLYQIMVKPYFTASESNGVAWRGMTGLLMLRGNDRAHVKAIQLRDDAYATVNFNFASRTRLYIKGCGFQHDDWHEKGLFTLEINDDEYGQAGDCILDGSLYSDSGNRTPISILLSRFSSDYIRLPLPEIVYEKTGTSVWADPSVSLISKNKITVFDNFINFLGPFEVLRFYTSKGRYAFCVYKENFRCYR